jgi:peptidoglycan/xylan/chitin deacetylase (PgdA/CDA1 family)
LNVFGFRDRFSALRRALCASQPTPTILMYHRVAEPPYDPWGLAVAPHHFSDQLRALARTRNVISMDQLAARLARRALRGNEVAITFDDGYADNLAVAKPLLTRAGAPATIFVTTDFLGSGVEFWWDELAHLCLGGTAAVDAEVELGGKMQRLTLMARNAAARSAWCHPAPPTTEREKLYLALWRALQRLEDSERSACMQRLRAALGAAPMASANLPMRREDLPRLIAGGLITVGGHTRRHPTLTALSRAQKLDEIEGCRRELEGLTSAPISGFAYPFGDRDDEAKALTRTAGYSWAVCTHSAPIDRGHFDLFDLPRIAVPNVSGEELTRRLAGLEAA